MNTLRPHHETTEIPELEIQREAHRLWLEKGQPEGRDVEIWLEAKELLKHRIHSQSSGSASHSREIHFPPSAQAYKQTPARRKQAKA